MNGHKRSPVAIIDIGSNSIRMVVFERLSRALTPLYNEKSSCALGQGVASTGRLDATKIEKALKAMRRFALFLRLMNVERAYCVATSAVREAENGPAFAAEVEEIIGVKVQILTGKEEAHFAALGAISGMPAFEGIVGDLGGGSLELSSLVARKVDNEETFELGVIRLIEDSDGSPKRAAEIARSRLKKPVSPLSKKINTFCAIGGTWRAIAKLHQTLNDYPLQMVQNYSIDADVLVEFCKKIVTEYERDGTYDGAEFVSSARRPLVPFGAAMFIEIMRAGKFRKVVFSAPGVREGFLFAKLDKAERKKDPLIQICREISFLRSRSPAHSPDLFEFSSKLVKAIHLRETGEQKILREAACLLADIGWRGHPDYRGEQAIDLVAFGALAGIDHPGRAFLARTLAVRYIGLKRAGDSRDLLDLCGSEAGRRAEIFGALFRVAFVMSAGMAGVLPKAGFRHKTDCLELTLPQEFAFLDGRRLYNRLTQMAVLTGFERAEITLLLNR